MSNASSLKFQTTGFDEMEHCAPYTKMLCGLRYTVLPRVYGGGTDTELLCDCLDIHPGDDVWDIGTGTGVIAITAEKAGARYVLATDRSPEAIKNARRNVADFRAKVQVRQADVYQGIRKKFDVLIFNPPFTNRRAMKLYQICFWDKGNAAVRKFFSGIRSHLKKGGRAFLCWSDFEETGLLRNLARDHDLLMKKVGSRLGGSSFSYYIYRITVPNRPMKH